MTRPRERPILFSGPMVRAILAGTKTQTRRIIKHRHAFITEHTKTTAREASDHDNMPLILRPEDESAAKAYLTKHSPYGVPGDRLWVRETWLYVGPGSGSEIDGPIEQARGENQKPANCWYRATPISNLDVGTYRWTPSIHMPRWASRLTLEVTEVRVQRLAEISEEDAWAEGIGGQDCGPLTVDGRVLFASAWDALNGRKARWESNPWVWAISFRRLGA